MQKPKSKTSVLHIRHCRNESRALSKLFRQLGFVIVERASANRQYTTATDTINFIKVYPVCPGTGAICWRVIDAQRLGTKLDLPHDQFNFSKLEFLLNCGNEV